MITYRRYEDKDISNYHSAFKQVFNSQMDHEYFLWKHKENIAHFDVPLVYIACTDNGDIVGANSFFWSELVFKERSYPVVQSGDTLVVKNHRGKGLFVAILEYALKDLKRLGCKACIGFANSNSLPGFLKMGFERVSGVLGYERDLRYRTLLQSFPGVKSLLFLLSNISNDNPLLDVEKQNLNNINFLSLFEQWEGGDIHIKKNEMYLQRKYLEKPNSTYEGYSVTKGDKTVAVFIIRSNNIIAKYRSGTIMEIATDNQKDMSSIFNVLLRGLSKRGYVKLSTWIVGKMWLKKFCNNNQLFKKGIPLHFIIRLLDDDFNPSPTSWHFVPGDADTA